MLNKVFLCAAMLCRRLNKTYFDLSCSFKFGKKVCDKDQDFSSLWENKEVICSYVKAYCMFSCLVIAKHCSWHHVYLEYMVCLGWNLKANMNKYKLYKSAAIFVFETYFDNRVFARLYYRCLHLHGLTRAVRNALQKIFLLIVVLNHQPSAY